MANSVPRKIPTTGTVIYDSINDTSTGKKRAVVAVAGQSVAERARLFGTQIKAAPPKPQQIQRPPINQQSKSNIVNQDRNYQQANKNSDRYPEKEVPHSAPQKPSNRPPAQFNDRAKREQPSSTNSQNYSTVTRPTTKQTSHSHNRNQQSSTYQRPVSSYDSSQPIIPQQQKQASRREHYNKIAPNEIHTFDDDPYLILFEREKSPPYQQQQQQQPLFNSGYPTSNYFQPIQDPLEAMLKATSQVYSQQQIPMRNNTALGSMQSFDLGNLINRIQEDYIQNVQPYVSSIQYIENNHEYDPNLADIGFITPANTRKGYTQQTNDIYRRQVPSRYYDYNDKNGFRSYKQTYTKRSFNDNQYSSRDRRKHRTRYHDQASSPIPLPATAIPKALTPTPINSSEDEEDEEEATTTSQSKVSKPAQRVLSDTRSVTSSESATTSEEESQKKSSTTLSQPPVSKPVDATYLAPATTATQASQRGAINRPILPNQTASTTARNQAKQSETEESETEESDSESDSDTEEEDNTPKPTSTTRSNYQNPISGTPITRTANKPQINSRVVPQERNTDNNTDQPPEVDPEDFGQSSSFTNRIKSITSKFRRKKSEKISFE